MSKPEIISLCLTCRYASGTKPGLRIITTNNDKAEYATRASYCHFLQGTLIIINDGDGNFIPDVKKCIYYDLKPECIRSFSTPKTIKSKNRDGTEGI